VNNQAHDQVASENIGLKWTKSDEQSDPVIHHCHRIWDRKTSEMIGQIFTSRKRAALTQPAQRKCQSTLHGIVFTSRVSVQSADRRLSL
jgi:hypothetical protein